MPPILMIAIDGQKSEEDVLLKQKMAAILACMVLITSLCGYTTPTIQPVQSSSGGSSSGRTTVRERINRLLEKQKQAESSSSSQPSSGSSKAPASSKPSSGSSKAPASSKPEEEPKVGPSLEDIAQLTGLKAGVELRRRDCIVDVDEGENPYDVTWDYGELYDAFVQEVDWDLLFDGDYYIQTFPGLAHLYHKDKALLLRHFQTVGIHEGRQGRSEEHTSELQSR